MDYRLALVQDTSNRSFPVDDYTGDGVANDADTWPASRIPAVARPCGGTSGVVDGRLDWNCDGVLSRADSAPRAYKGWLTTLARELLDEARYGAAAVDHVFVIQKPLEMGQCNLYPAAEQATCNANRHAIRTPGADRGHTRPAVRPLLRADGVLGVADGREPLLRRRPGSARAPGHA